MQNPINIDFRFRPFLNRVSEDTSLNFNEHVSGLKEIVKFMFGEEPCHEEVTLKQLFQFLAISRKFVLERPLQCHIKSVVRMANIVLGRKLTAVADERTYFETFFTILLYHEHFKDINHSLYDNTDSLLKDYPCFEYLRQEDEVELMKLLLFRNWMKVALLVIPSHHNKGRLLNTVTRICEGDNIKYITGSGQHGATDNRVIIYEFEGNISKRIRPPRRPKEFIEMDRLGLNFAYEIDDCIDNTSPNESLEDEQKSIQSLSNSVTTSQPPVHLVHGLYDNNNNNNSTKSTITSVLPVTQPPSLPYPYFSKTECHNQRTENPVTKSNSQSMSNVDKLILAAERRLKHAKNKINNQLSSSSSSCSSMVHNPNSGSNGTDSNKSEQCGFKPAYTNFNPQYDKSRANHKNLELFVSTNQLPTTALQSTTAADTIPEKNNIVTLLSSRINKTAPNINHNINSNNGNNNNNNNNNNNLLLPSPWNSKKHLLKSPLTSWNVSVPVTAAAAPYTTINTNAINTNNSTNINASTNSSNSTNNSNSNANARSEARIQNAAESFARGPYLLNSNNSNSNNDIDIANVNSNYLPPAAVAAAVTSAVPLPLATAADDEEKEEDILKLMSNQSTTSTTTSNGNNNSSSANNNDNAIIIKSLPEAASSTIDEHYLTHSALSAWYIESNNSNTDHLTADFVSSVHVPIIMENKLKIESSQESSSSVQEVSLAQEPSSSGQEISLDQESSSTGNAWYNAGTAAVDDDDVDNDVHHTHPVSVKHTSSYTTNNNINDQNNDEEEADDDDNDNDNINNSDDDDNNDDEDIYYQPHGISSNLRRLKESVIKPCHHTYNNSNSSSSSSNSCNSNSRSSCSGNSSSNNKSNININCNSSSNSSSNHSKANILNRTAITTNMNNNNNNNTNTTTTTNNNNNNDDDDCIIDLTVYDEALAEDVTLEQLSVCYIAGLKNELYFDEETMQNLHQLYLNGHFQPYIDDNCLDVLNTATTTTTTTAIAGTNTANNSATNNNNNNNSATTTNKSSMVQSAAAAAVATGIGEYNMNNDMLRASTHTYNTLTTNNSTTNNSYANNSNSNANNSNSNANSNIKVVTKKRKKAPTKMLAVTTASTAATNINTNHIDSGAGTAEANNNNNSSSSNNNNNNNNNITTTEAEEAEDEVLLERLLKKYLGKVTIKERMSTMVHALEICRSNSERSQRSDNTSLDCNRSIEEIERELEIDFTNAKLGKKRKIYKY